jgi:hypothetical protein
MPSRRFQKFASIFAIFAFFTANVSTFMALVATKFNMDIFLYPGIMLTELAGKGYIAKYSTILDMFGFYLPLIPLVLMLYWWLRKKDYEFVTLATICGLAYCLLGALGAAVGSSSISAQMNYYASATMQMKDVHHAIFILLNDFVEHGVWASLDTFLAGTWLIVINNFLRKERKAIGWFGIITGAFYSCYGIGEVTGLKYLGMIGLSVYLLLTPIWAASVGISVLRKPIINEEK